MTSHSRGVAECARYAPFVILGLFVVLIAVPSPAKPWLLGTMGLGVLVLLACLAVWWLDGAPEHPAVLPLTGLFAVGLVVSVLYLRSLPDAAIPLAGVGAMLICLVGLAVTGVSLRHR